MLHTASAIAAVKKLFSQDSWQNYLALQDAGFGRSLADARIFAKLTPSVIVTRLMGDSQVASMQLANALTVLLRDGTAAIFLLCKLLASQPKLTLMAFLILPILAGGLRFVRLRVRKVSDAAYQRSQHLVELTEDLARAWRVIRTFDAAQFERERRQHLRGARERSTLRSRAASSKGSRARSAALSRSNSKPSRRPSAETTSVGSAPNTARAALTG